MTHDNWFGGVYQDEKNFFPQFVIDPENQRQVFPEFVVPDDQWNAFLKDRQGAIVGREHGQAFWLEDRRPHPIKTTIYGGGRLGVQSRRDLSWPAPGGRRDAVLVSVGLLRGARAGASRARLDGTPSSSTSPDDAVRVAKAIDDEFANSPYETKTETNPPLPQAG